MAGPDASGSDTPPVDDFVRVVYTDEEIEALGMWPSRDVEPGNTDYVTPVKFPGFEHLPFFSIRNGEASDAKPLMVRATINDGFHWAPVSGVAPKDAVDHVDAYIMSALYQLSTHPPAGYTTEAIRKAAIVLGTSRANMTKHYELRPGDFIGGELAPCHLDAWTAKDGTIRYRPTVPKADPLYALLSTPITFTKLENDVVAMLLQSSLGVLPVQGYSIVMTGHHYLSDPGNQSYRAFSVIEKQFWGANAVKEFFTDDIVTLRDVAWHKSGHPVSMALKEDLACDERVANMIREAGVGSAASRLPAMETQLRTAGSYMALMTTVDPLFAMFKGSANCGAIADIVGEIKAWSRREVRATAPREWPEYVLDRKKALAWLGDVLQRNAPKVAYCYGFYCALTEQNQALSTGTAGDTLKTSFSLSKLKNTNNASFVEGSLAYADYAAARTRRRAEGKYVAAVMDVEI